MLNELNAEDRLSLVRFVCSFMWADLRVADAEREVVRKLVDTLELDEDDRDRVTEWMTHPPSPEELDPSDVPIEHRALFIETVRTMIKADGIVDDLEAENLALFEELLT
jgi:uncharacterized tellurite resistance protein B-like protein